MKNSKLKDHKPSKENKKVYNPPIINMLGKAPVDPEWRKITIPESLWLDDIMNHQEFSDPRGFCFEVTKVLNECVNDESYYPLGFISDFCIAIEGNAQLLNEKLSEKGLGVVFSDRFKKIVSLYSRCQLNNFLKNKNQKSKSRSCKTGSF